MTIKTKKFVANKNKQPEESIPAWKKRMKNENPNFKEVDGSLCLSERGGTATVHCTEQMFSSFNNQ